MNALSQSRAGCVAQETSQRMQKAEEGWERLLGGGPVALEVHLLPETAREDGVASTKPC